LPQSLLELDDTTTALYRGSRSEVDQRLDRLGDERRGSRASLNRYERPSSTLVLLANRQLHVDDTTAVVEVERLHAHDQAALSRVANVELARLEAGAGVVAGAVTARASATACS
jgi:hypothetical protein